MEHHEIIVIGSGVAGIYQIKRLVDDGIDAIVLESDDDLGGTWYRNRYPGCRFDSESYTYGYSFSEELLDEWHWKERFSAQPDTLEYLRYVADKYDLRKHMQFNTKVSSMTWDEEAREWQIDTENGKVYRCRYLITAMGIMSVPTTPKLEGVDSFSGECFHSYWWPKEGIDLAGRRVGVIGTGATGIQIVSAIADKVGHLTVFQRRPNWSTPLNNSEISEEEMAEIRSRYSEIFQTCAMTHFGFEHVPDMRGFNNVSAEERIKSYDRLYETPGFAVLAGNFPEIIMDETANGEMSEYVANRIRQRVEDPEVAERLIPKDHGFGMQRLPLETRYFEAYNRENVQLVDISETPIEEVTPAGIKTINAHYDLDVIIFATGFDAITGAFSRIEVRGVDGQLLNDKWAEDPLTYMGLMSHGFPNFIMVGGPQSVSGANNFPRGLETAVDWVTDLVKHVRSKGVTRIESQAEAEREWLEEVKGAYQLLLFRKGKGWFTGHNKNIEGRDQNKIRHHMYFGGGPRYAELIREAAENGYQRIDMDGGVDSQSSAASNVLAQGRL